MDKPVDKTKLFAIILACLFGGWWLSSVQEVRHLESELAAMDHGVMALRIYDAESREPFSASLEYVSQFEHSRFPLINTRVRGTGHFRIAWASPACERRAKSAARVGGLKVGPKV